MAPIRKQLARAQQQLQQLLGKRDDLEHQIQALRAELGTPLGGQLSPAEAALLQTLSARVQALEGEVSAAEAARDDAQALAEQLDEQLEGTLRGALQEALQTEDAGGLRCGQCHKHTGEIVEGCIFIHVCRSLRVCDYTHVDEVVDDSINYSSLSMTDLEQHTNLEQFLEHDRPCYSAQLDKESAALQAAASALQQASTIAQDLATRLAQAEQRKAALKGELDILKDALTKEAQLGQVRLRMRM